MNRRVLLAAPLVIAGAGGAAFYAMLNRMESGSFDPRGVPSMLIGKPVPQFSLVAGDGGFSSSDLAAGHPVLVNFFASWCVPCVEEAPLLLAVRRKGIPLYGIAYKDKPDAARKYFARNGDPYDRLAFDEPGRVAIDWGVTGVPESYLIDGKGIVRWRYVGPLTEDVALSGLPSLVKTYG